jgi:hypothetical protein
MFRLQKLLGQTLKMLSTITMKNQLSLYYSPIRFFLARGNKTSSEITNCPHWKVTPLSIALLHLADCPVSQMFFEIFTQCFWPKVKLQFDYYSICGPIVKCTIYWKMVYLWLFSKFSLPLSNVWNLYTVFLTTIHSSSLNLVIIPSGI